MKRVDQWLVELGLVPSRTRAKELLERGSVSVRKNNQWTVLKNGSEKFQRLSANEIQLANDELLKFVARSGLKLEGALRDVKLDVTGFVCLDVGQSTGGFTDCLLQSGAKNIIGIDVGHDQLAETLKNHPQVIFHEGINARSFCDHALAKEMNDFFDLLVMDISFISVRKVLSDLTGLVKKDGKLLILIKPQFELGPGALNKKGIVRDEKVFLQLEQEMVQHFADIGLQQIEYFESQLTGRDGNREFFVYAKK